MTPFRSQHIALFLSVVAVSATATRAEDAPAPPPAAVEPAKASDAPPAEAKPAEAKPAEAKPAEAKPATPEPPAPVAGEPPKAKNDDDVPDGEEDEIVAEQSVDGYTELEDAQPGKRNHFEERLWLTWGYVPAEGYTPSDTLEISYTGQGLFANTEIDLAQYFEHDDVDNSTAFTIGWMQRWLKDGGRDSLIPSVGTLTEYYLRTPFLIDLPAFAPGATPGDHLTEIVTVAKFVGPGTLYVNGGADVHFFNTQICVDDNDVALQPKDAPDKNGPALPNFDGCDYWSPVNFLGRVGYKLPIVPDKVEVVEDFTVETNEFSNQVKSKTLTAPEQHFPYFMGNLTVIWHVDENWTVAPGILLGLDGRAETPTYEAGVFIMHE